VNGRIVLGALCALVVLVGGAAAETTASAQGVVISEFRTRGPVGGSDEFVELYNTTGADVAIGGWLVRGSNTAGTVSTRATIPASTTLGAGCHYLVTNATASTGYSGSVPGDLTYLTGITDDGGIALTLADTTTVVDQVGMSSGSAYKEGITLTPLTTNLDRGYERKPGGASGNGQDTDDNSSDFSLVTPNNPQNKLSTCISTGPTNPSGIGAASPGTVAAGGSSLLTVAVTPGANPASTGLAVTADLSTIGGSATQQLFDDGTNGDVTSGDNTFSYQATVAAATTAGAKTLAASISDAQARSGSASIGLTVTASGPVAGDVVISEVYGGGGNVGATYKNDFVELYNRTGSSISLAGWSVQYASSAGTTWQTTALSGSIAAGAYYLVQEGAGTGGDLALPGPDATGGIAMAAGSGKVALLSSTTALSGACPTGGAIIDFVGYGSANCSETSPAPTLTNTTSASRANGGATDTNNNSADFTAGVPNPRGTADPAPTVTSTAPGNGTSDVGTSANIVINFSEPVSPTGSWFTINCANSGSHTAAVTSNAGSYELTLNPDTDFGSVESCTVTVVGAQVSDLDTFDPPDTMAANYVFSFTTADVSVCGDPRTQIHTVQGNGATSPIAGSSVAIEGVVGGDYQAAGEFGGFYVQEADSDVDADPATSEGIFVFSTLTNVSVGDRVRVRGTVTEFATGTSSLTELTGVSAISVCTTGNPVPTAVTVTLPVSAMSNFERYEGMRVHFSQTLTANETFTLARFGEVRLAEGGRLYTPTAVTTPGVAAIAQEDLNNRRSFVLDDGNNQQNIDPTLYPTGGLSAANTLRSGYTVDNLDGVFDERFSTYRVQPVGPVSFTAANPRTPAPDAVGGNLKVGSFNVLNFFNGDGLGGGFPTARGANTQFELDRQKAKEVSALSAMNADIVGLMEIENDAPPNSAIEELVAALNSAMGAGTYAFINTGVIGTDEIKVALIYKPASVTPVGAYQIITSATDPRFIDTKNRPSLAQTFQKNSNGEKLTVVVNHLKSKGSDCNDVNDPDTGDGQGNCNLTRQKAAAAISDWLATDPTGSGDSDFLLIGDMNSYTFEDPTTTFIGKGFTNLARLFGGLAAYSYVFDGESGYLDHALASSSLTAQATGTTHWHINADEPIALDYNTEFKTANQVNTFYNPGPYRSSDHDPVVIGLELNTPPTATFNAPASAFAGLPFTLSLTNPSDPDTGDTFTYAFDCGNGYGAFGSSSSISCDTPTDVDALSVGGKIRDSEGATTEYRATVDVTVTLESLCALTRVYSSSAKVADKLCDLLAKGPVSKFTKEVQKQAGLAFTQEEAATLVRLAGEL
jgi:predicted extracellular nuclease